MLIKKLFRTLWQYKAQFISMVIMVALGIGVFLGFNVEWYSLEVNTKEIYEATGYADFRIYSDKGFSPEDLEAVKGIDGVEDATRFLSLNVSVKDDTDTLALTVTENSNVSGVLVMEGEPYSAEDPDGFWLSDSYAAANGIKLGDPLTLTYQMITVKGTVKGLVKASEYLICLPDSTQMMPDYSSYGFVYISPAMLDQLWARFPAFLDRQMPADPLKCEYYLPAVANAVLQEKLGTVRVLECGEVWHGVTYREDLQSVVDAIAALKEAGVYPALLWD